MSKPNYRLILSFDAGRQVFMARVPELAHCTAEGATRAEAIAKAEEEINAQLANMLSHGSTPPKAVDEEEFSGEVTAKLSRALHRDLAYLARQDGIEIDHLVGELLSAAVESRRSQRPGARSGNRAPAEDAGNRHDGNTSGGGGGGGNFRGGGAGNFRGGRGQYNPALEDRANFIEYVRGLEHGQGQNRGGGGGGGGGGAPGGGGSRDNGRRRRGGRGGQGHPGQGGQGGPRRDFQGGGPRPHQPPRESAPAVEASAPPPAAFASGGEPEPGNS